jgi:hypothetical protein
VKPVPSGPTRWQSRLFGLNSRQTRALVAGVFGFIFIGLFPPWNHVFVNEIGAIHRRPAGFHAILGPPDMSGNPNWRGCQVDWALLAIEWAVAVGITAVFIYGLRDRNPLTRRLLNRYEVD